MKKILIKILIFIGCLIGIYISWIGPSLMIRWIGTIGMLLGILCLFIRGISHEFTDSALIIHTEGREDKKKVIPYSSIKKVEVVEIREKNQPIGCEEAEFKYSYKFVLYDEQGKHVAFFETPYCEDKEDERIMKVIRDLSKIGEVFRKDFEERHVKETLYIPETPDGYYCGFDD